MFKHAIVKKPCRAMIEGITSSPELGKPDYEKALKQHSDYVEALKATGVTVTVLEADEAFPDSCFVEDTAVITRKCAIVSNPGAPSRQMEAANMLPTLQQFFDEDHLEYIEAPGTLEGGDVMMVGDHFYVGESERTNQEGIRQFLAILEKHGLSGEAVPFEKILHLKTGVNYLENDNMLVSGEFIGMDVFANYHCYEVPDEEAYASNCIWMNGKVIVPAGFPTVEALVRRLGYEVILVDTSEYRKIDGGLSCLSLRF